MKRQTLVEIGVFAVIVMMGIQVRIQFWDLPNFAPVAALALFAGYFFRSALVALCVPLTVMIASDMWMDRTYDWRVMIVVYTMLALPVAMRGVLRSRLTLRRAKLRAAILSVAGLLSCSLFSSILFFLATNFPSWLWFGYEHSVAGLFHCYAQALPFFRFTLTGDMLFAALLFGSYALAVNVGFLTQHEEESRIGLAASQ